MFTSSFNRDPEEAAEKRGPTPSRSWLCCDESPIGRRSDPFFQQNPEEVLQVTAGPQCLDTSCCGLSESRSCWLAQDLKNDYAFKSIFGSQRRSHVLAHLLNSILLSQGLRVQTVRILNPLSDIHYLDEKKLILDVKAVDDHGRVYNVEMQMVPAPSFPERILYYWSHAYGRQLKEGQGYEQLRPVISICFLNGILFPDTNRCHLRFQLLENAASFPFTNDLDLHLFQLPLFIKTADDLEGDLDLWLYVLNNGRGLDLEHLPGKLQVKEVEETLEALAMLTQDGMQREIYEAREKARRDAEDWRSALQRARESAQEGYAKGREEGREEGHEEGRQEGRQEGRLEGRELGMWIGRIRSYEELLKRPPKPDAELASMTVDEMSELAERLRDELLKA